MSAFDEFSIQLLSKNCELFTTFGLVSMVNSFTSWTLEVMDVPDSCLIHNHDWDPSYLSQLLSDDFFDFNELWSNNMGDVELVQEVEKVEKYCPTVEDISMDDEVLCNAVEKIEEE